MNIVWLAPFAYTPKATVSARMMPMATALCRRGHTVTVLVPPYDNPADSGKVWERDGVHVENMRLPRVQSSGYAILSLAWQMARRARRLQPDAIHVFKPVGPGALAMWLLRRWTPRIPILVDNDDWEGAGGWLDVNPYSVAQKRVLAWQERWCLRKARVVTCASHALIERTRLLAGDKPMALLPNGPDNSLREKVAQAELRRDKLRELFGWRNKRVLIYAGTVPLNHDLDIAVRAIAAIRAGLTSVDNSPDLRWVIIATGAGLPSLQTAIQQAGLQSLTEYHGFMPHDQLIQRLVAADIALYPYRDSNINRAKCSGKVIDYMACGKPMVVSDVGMNHDYLEHGVSGLLTAPGDAEAFASALAQMLRDPLQAGSLGRAAQARLWERYGWDGRVETLEAFYQQTA
ncbi:MAG: glycosyltransferase family 4 protein [Anaerolineae bacterium]